MDGDTNQNSLVNEILIEGINEYFTTNLVYSLLRGIEVNIYIKTIIEILGGTAKAHGTFTNQGLL